MAPGIVIDATLEALAFLDDAVQAKAGRTLQVNAALDSAQSIHNTVRNKLTAHIKTLEFRYKVKPDEKMKAEIEKLKVDLEGLPESGSFFHGAMHPRA